MTFSHRNFSFQDPPCSEGDVFEHCNVMQLQPATAICVGVAGLTFRHCNLVNCQVPGDATVEHCNAAQISRCAHLHKKWELPAEPDNCPHVTSTDEVWIDGLLVDTTYHREDTVL